jgi:pimeloyl-ACP methyl ester carboxylesterase
MSTRAEYIDVNGSKIEVMIVGSGPDLLVLHGCRGKLRWGPFLGELSASYRVVMPSHPGFDTSERPEWVTSIPDLAAWYGGFVDVLGLADVRVIGFDLGGWLAAEWAARCGHGLSAMILVAPLGIRPPRGEIADVLFMSPAAVGRIEVDAPLTDRVAAEAVSALEQWMIDRNRETTARLAWQPFLHNPNLPGLLGERMRTPTQIVWGARDRVVPLACGFAYRDAIAGSELVVMENVGHLPHVEDPAELARHVHRFFETVAPAATGLSTHGG